MSVLEVTLKVESKGARNNFNCTSEQYQHQGNDGDSIPTIVLTFIVNIILLFYSVLLFYVYSNISLSFF